MYIVCLYIGSNLLLHQEAKTYQICTHTFPLVQQISKCRHEKCWKLLREKGRNGKSNEIVTWFISKFYTQLFIVVLL